MKYFKYSIFLILLLSIIGCSVRRGFDRGMLNNRFQDRNITTDEDIEKVLNLKPQIKFPFKLGIYMPNSFQWSKTLKDKHAINQEWIEDLKKENVISDVVFISNVTLEGNKLKNIRLAAARYGADAVLIVDDVTDFDRYNNIGSVLYLTIVGLWIVPGTHVESLVLMRGAMFDVRNEYLYLSLESEGGGEKMGIAMYLENEEAISIARTEAMTNFMVELKSRLKSLKGK
ncbi:MAG: hypothetical protein MI922_18105 [Bacteroidales bacterium]|nr:hypothetical protein [Bacteroidales bacterium]